MNTTGYIPTQEEIEEIIQRSNELKEMSPDRILLGKSALPHAFRPFVARRVALWKRWQHKFPAFAEAPFFIPTEVAFQQASSEVLAKHKAQYVNRDTHLIDGTGGLGIDFYYMSRDAHCADYFELDPLLYAAAEYNISRLDIGSAHTLHHSNSIEALKQLRLSTHTLLYLDPARRDAGGRKTFLLEDTLPNPLEVVDLLKSLNYQGRILLKLSPMLDIEALLHILPQASHISIQAVGDEVKELLLYIESIEVSTCTPEQIPLHVHIYSKEGAKVSLFSCSIKEEREAQATIAEEIGPWLYLPHPALLKAGAFKLLSTRYNVQKLATDSHLYTSKECCEAFPGRVYHIEEVLPWKSGLHKQLKGRWHEADITVKNFPLTRAALYKTLHLREGSAVRLIATQVAQTPVLIHVTPH